MLVVAPVRCAQSAVSVFIMFSAYILHSWAMPFLTRENVPQTFYDIVGSEPVDVRAYLLLWLRRC